MQLLSNIIFKYLVGRNNYATGIKIVEIEKKRSKFHGASSHHLVDFTGLNN